MFNTMLLAVTFALFTFATPATAPGDLDCGQFGSWDDAQATHEASPWMWLDGDWDSISCECLYYDYPC